MCKLFKKEDVDVVLLADETFLRFHECTNKVLAFALSVNEKDGCSVMITLDMHLNKALSPFIIFTGVFSALLMKEFKEMTNNTVSSTYVVM